MGCNEEIIASSARVKKVQQLGVLYLEMSSASEESRFYSHKTSEVP